MDNKKGATTAGVLLATLFLTPLLVIGGVAGLGAAAQAAQCGPQGPALNVDPASVPQGPILGWQHEQLVLAASIAQTGAGLQLTRRDQQIAIMTAMAESSLRILTVGDAVGPDSRGLFQQRANGAWGTLEDRLNATISATNFYTSLTKVPDRASLKPWQAAHIVQRNADAGVYKRRWQEAGAVLQALAGVQPVSTPVAKASSPYGLDQSSDQAKLVANTIGQKFPGVKISPGKLGEAMQGTAPGNILSLQSSAGPGSKKLITYLTGKAEQLSIERIDWKGQTWSADNDEGWQVVPTPPKATPPKAPSKPPAKKLAATRPPAPKNPAKPAKKPSAVDNIQVVVTAAVTNLGGQCAGDDAGLEVEEAAGIVNANGWTPPTRGSVSSPFGQRVHPISGLLRPHYGIDYAPGCGAPIWSASTGIVVYAGAARGFGNLIEIDHGNKIISRYGHMWTSGIKVRVGDSVQAGQPIAVVGSAGKSTGCHLHFEITRNGNALNPTDVVGG